jgi:hypothetical protein
MTTTPAHLYRSNGRQTVGDGAPLLDTVLAVCHVQGADDIYYYSTTFSGGPGVGFLWPLHFVNDLLINLPVAVLTPLMRNALLTEGRRAV